MAWDDDILSAHAGHAEPESAAGLGSELRVAAAPYLSAQPLLFGIDGESPLSLSAQPPHRIWHDLIAEQAHAGLLPVLELQRDYSPLIVIPAGCVSCAGTCLCARIYSRVPARELTSVCVGDGGCRTATALASVIWGVEFRRRLKIVPLDASRHVPPDAQAVLLVEDAVVSHPPLGYHYQLDLGAMWFEISGLPFVFSVWAAEDGAHLQEIHDLLAASRAKGVKHLRSIARQQAPRIGWPEDLARRYLLDQLRYEFTDAHRDGMEEFFYLCQAVGVIEHVKPVKYLYEPK